MGHKSYTATKREPFSFDIDGVEFACRPSIPAMVILDLTGSLGDVSKLKVAIDELLSAVLQEPDFERLQAMLRDPAAGVGLDVLMKILTDVAEHYTSDETGEERPTQEDSSNGSSTRSTGDGSTDGHSRTAQTYSRPEPKPRKR